MTIQSLPDTKRRFVRLEHRKRSGAARTNEDEQGRKNTMDEIRGSVSIDAQNMMPIIKKWLYSDKDIFIREVVSNGCDAITKLRMVDAEAAKEGAIRVEVDKDKRELRFYDNGIGMTEDEVMLIYGKPVSKQSDGTTTQYMFNSFVRVFIENGKVKSFVN